jgi:hypothetical protein
MQDDLMELLARIEEAVGELYILFSGRFAAFPAAAEFWRQLAADEADHAVVLRAGSESEALPVDGLPTGPDPCQVKQNLEHLGRLRQQAGEGVISLEGALALAYGVEHSLAERHLRIAPYGGALQQLLQRLAEQDEEHLARLRAFAAGRGIFLPHDP